MDWLDQALDGDGGLTLVQQPIGRPDAIQRPGEIAPRQAAPGTTAPQMPPVQQAPAQPQQPGRNDDFLFEAPAAPIRPSALQQSQPGNPNAEPDATTWVGRRAQDVMGKTDKRYAELPTIAEVMLKDKSHRLAPEVGSWLVGASDTDMTGVYKEMLGERYVRDETDANGFPLVVYRGPDGAEARAYVNKPGLDMQDVVRGTVGMAPYAATGRLINAGLKGVSLVSRAAGQFLGQGATSVAQDAAAVVSGVSPIDWDKSTEKALVSGLGGAGGELVGAGLAAAWRKIVTEPKYINRATGALTPEGESAARSAGLNPIIMARGAAKDFAYQMARTGDAEAATKQVLANEFKIPRTTAELTGNKQGLLREQQMEGGSFGDKPAKDMGNFRTVQNKAIDNAVRGEIEPGKPGLAGQIAPDRAGARVGKDELGANIRANTQAALSSAKEAEEAAWASAPSFRANQAALNEIEPTIKSGLQSRKISVIEGGLTPQAKVMDDMIAEFQAGKAPINGSKYIERDLPGDVDIMRQRLLAAYQAADKPRDIAASKALYESFQDWMVVAAQKSGDPMKATKLLTARTMTRELHQTFDGMPGTPGANILKSILKTGDSPEAIVNALFSGSAKAEIKAGGVDALKALKQGYDKYLPKEAAKSAWDDVRLAYVMRIIEQKTGDTGGPAAMATAIKSALNNQATVAKLLLTDQERGSMQRLAMLLDDVKKRNPNTSWSGVAVGAMLKEIGNGLLTMVGANTVLGRMAIGAAQKPVTGLYGAAQVRAVTGAGRGATVPQRPVPSFGGVGGGVSGYPNVRSDDRNALAR